MKNTIQKIVQITTLALFILLIAVGKVQLWMGLLILGTLAAFIFGRFYCGWICSINTVLMGVTWVKKKLKIKSLEMPEFLKRPIVGYALFAAFIGVFALTFVTGKRFPLLPILSGTGILLTFLFPEELWHRCLCPYGTLMKVASLKTSSGMEIQEDLCNNCTACKRVCPANAVVKGETKHQIRKSDCLICFKCERSCKKNAIHYKIKNENLGAW